MFYHRGRLARHLGLAAVLLIGIALFGCAAIQDRLAQPEAPDWAAETSSPGRAAAYYSYLKAQLNLLSGQEGEATDYLVLALENDPSSSLLRVELITLLVQTKREDEAISLARASVETNPDDIKSRLLLAGLLSKQGQYQEAEEIYRQALDISPNQPEALLFLGSLLAQRKRYHEAAALLEKLVQEEPDDAMGHYTLAKVYAGMGDTDKVAAAYERVIELRPLFEAAYFDLAEVLNAAGKWEEAAGVYYRVLNRNPASRKAHRELARLYLDQGDVDKAVEILGEAGMAGGDGRLGVGLIYLHDEKYSDAAGIMEEVLAEEPDNQNALYYLASVYDEWGRADQAVETLVRIKPKSHHYVPARIRLTFILEEKGDHQGALSTVQEALRQEPDRPELFVALSTLYEANGQLEEAMATVQQGLEKEADNIELLFRKGVILDRKGLRQEGLDLMKRILELEPDHPHALNYVGYTWADQGVNLQEALDYILRSLEQLPESGYITDSLGWVYYRMERLEDAIKLLEKAVSIVQDDPIIHEHLAEALAARGRIKEAIAAYRRALELSPKDPERIKAMIERLKKGRWEKPPLPEPLESP